MFEELDAVALAEPVILGCWQLPAGKRGTVVGIWKQGEAYEVEFQGMPVPLTLPAAALRAAPVPVARPKP